MDSLRETSSYSAVAFDPIAGARLVFEAAGIKDNQLTLALDRVYMTYTGISALEAGQITINTPTKKQYLTPTEIGRILSLKTQEELTTPRVNEILASMGYQHKIAGRWEVLPKGEQFAVMHETFGLKWDADILDAIEARLPAEC